MGDRKHSGRNVTWDVRPSQMTNNAIVWRLKNPFNGKAKFKTRMDLCAYIVRNAAKGDADCISAILECPDDPLLQDALQGKMGVGI